MNQTFLIITIIFISVLISVVINLIILKKVVELSAHSMEKMYSNLWDFVTKRLKE